MDTTSPQAEATSPQEHTSPQGATTSTQEETPPTATQWQPKSYAIAWDTLRHIVDPLIEARPEVFLRTRRVVHERATALVFKHVTIGTVEGYRAPRGEASEHLFHLCNTRTGAKLPFPSFKVVHAYENLTGVQAPKIIWQPTSSGYRMPAKRRKEILKMISVVDSPVTVPKSFFRELPNLHAWRVYQSEGEKIPNGASALYYLPPTPTVVLFGPTRFHLAQEASMSTRREKIVLHLQPHGPSNLPPAGGRSGRWGNPRRFVIVLDPSYHSQESWDRIAMRVESMGEMLLRYALDHSTRHKPNSPVSSLIVVNLAHYLNYLRDLAQPGGNHLTLLELLKRNNWPAPLFTDYPELGYFLGTMLYIRLHVSSFLSLEEYKATISEEEAKVELEVSDCNLSHFI